MTKGEDILMFRMVGDVRPGDVASKDLGEILIGIEDSIKAIIGRDNPEYKLDELKIGLIEIVDKSEGLKFRVNLPVLVTAFTALGYSISSNSYHDLPSKSVESLSSIQAIIRKYKTSAKFYVNNKSIATLTQEAKIVLPDKVKVRGTTSIYGTIERVGGTEPKVRVRLISGETFSLDVSESFAKEAGNFLYDKVKIIGEAVWDVRDYSILSFKAKNIGEYRAKSNVRAFDNLKKVLGGAWDKIDNIEDILYKD